MAFPQVHNFLATVFDGSTSQLEKTDGGQGRQAIRGV
jgi:hypothetical protein